MTNKVKVFGICHFCKQNADTKTSNLQQILLKLTKKANV